MQFYQKWCLWVCMWNDPKLSESQDVTTTEDIEFLGNVVPQKTTIRHHGFLPDQPHLVKLTLDSTTEIDQAKDFVENAVEELGQTIKPEPSEDIPSSLSKVTFVEALIEPNTLKPHQVIMSAKTSVASNDKVDSMEEKHTFTFEWK